MTLIPADDAFAETLAARLPEGTLRRAEPRHLEEPRGRMLGVQCALSDGCGARLVRRRERGEQLVLGKEPGWG